MTYAPTFDRTLRTAFAWHRPLMILAAAMAGLTVVGIVGMLLDPRTVTGLPVWDKPTKFAISILVYAVTWAWLFDQIQSRRRLRGTHAAGTVAAVLLGVEMVVIVGQAGRGTTSHFNVSTGFDATLWTIMAASIGVAYLATLLLVVALFRVRDGDPARTLAIRAGATIALVGMGLGFLMTGPTSAQLADPQGVVGAHTVGLPDGGPGLPLLGWSTTGGDLRIPHFVGMHALQAIPLLLICLELLATRVPLLRAWQVRRRLIVVAAAGYSAVLALLTWQALRGQSIVAPDTRTLMVTVAFTLAVLAGVRWAVRAPATQAKHALSTAA